MQSFDIVKKCEHSAVSFRVSKVQSDFDISFEHAQERFTGEIEIPDKWKIGLIVGGSGTGKTTIAKELWQDAYIDKFKYSHECVIDDMPKDASVDTITKTFYAVGFGSVPSWLKPYDVLSNGEKMRVDLARAILEKDFVVFDEFTSVVDRTVAKTACVAISKCLEKQNKKIILLSCHYDIIDWLQPDWVFDTNTMKNFFHHAHDQNKHIKCEDVGQTSGQSLEDIII